jgi:hypothetical protein
MSIFIHLFKFSYPLEYAPLKPKKRDNKENMMDALFMANKTRGDGDDEEEEEHEIRGKGNMMDSLYMANKTRQELPTHNEEPLQYNENTI